MGCTFFLYTREIIKLYRALQGRLTACYIFWQVFRWDFFFEGHRVQFPGNRLVTGDLPPSMGATKQSVRIFTEQEIEIITGNYSIPIGKGGFGEVYRGALDGGDTDLVAVKRYIRKDLRKEFMEEVKIHSQMSHKNVARFIGYCIGGSTLMLVTEYVSGGNLDQLLHCSGGTPIPLDVRLGVAVGCAEALSYMHSMNLSSGNLVYHGDIKPANILLDDSLTTKVSDFGLSRLLFGGITQFTTTLKGSIGYTDPVYLHEGCLTPRSDVYSFGVVLLELISRKRAKQGDANLIQAFSKARVTKGRRSLGELFDAEVAGGGSNSVKALKEMRKLALECLTLDMHTRPQMSDVAKRLRMLKKGMKGCIPQSILATHTVWRRKDRRGTSMPSFKSFFKGNDSSKVLSQLGSNNVRIFTVEEISEVTGNYSCLLGGGTYRGTLEDNARVAVRRLLHRDSKEAFLNGGVTLSQVVHQNIVKLLGCCLEAEALVFVYEYLPRGSLLDVLGGQEDLPLHLRLRIAIKIAEALEFLHSSAAGVMGHGGITASSILLDGNFVPKLADFSVACKLIVTKESEAAIGSSPLEKILRDDPARYGSVLMNMESDVYRFGGILLALIARETDADLIAKFTTAYEEERSGRALFDRSMTAEQDIRVLDEIGRLALKCAILNVDEMPKRPTMKELAEELRVIQRSWKGRSNKSAIQVIGAAPAVSSSSAQAQPRLPNLMRHLYGYRRISVDDPVHA
jgi:serine/threonine protein kinase